MLFGKILFNLDAIRSCCVRKNRRQAEAILSGATPAVDFPSPKMLAEINENVTIV